MGYLENEISKQREAAASREAALRQKRLAVVVQVEELLNELAPEFAAVALRSKLGIQHTKEFFKSKSGWFIEVNGAHSDVSSMNLSHFCVLILKDGTWRVVCPHSLAYGRVEYSLLDGSARDLLFEQLSTVYDADGALKEIRRAFVRKLQSSTK